MDQRQKKKQIRNMTLTAGGLLVVVVGGVALVASWLSGEPPPPPKKPVQQISLVRPPPPPPKDEPPPPPPEEEIPEEIPTPEDMPEPMDNSNEPPPGDLGLDAEGVAGADGFGLVARKGGRSILDAGGSQYRWYAGVLQQELVAHLADYKKVRSRPYSITVSLWLNPDGSIDNVLLDGSTGDLDLDDELLAALSNLDSIAQTPPRNLPQPVQLRIVSRL